MTEIQVAMRIAMCNRNADVAIPTYKKPGDAGMDIQADIDEMIILQPGERALVPCGFKLEVPEGFEVQVRPRSGLSNSNGISVVNAPGTVDSGYRGEIKVNLINLGQVPFSISPAMRIAQIVLAPVVKAILIETDTLSDSVRGENGYGSTGTSHSAT